MRMRILGALHAGLVGVVGLAGAGGCTTSTPDPGGGSALSPDGAAALLPDGGASGAASCTLTIGGVGSIAATMACAYAYATLGSSDALRWVGGGPVPRDGTTDPTKPAIDAYTKDGQKFRAGTFAASDLGLFTIVVPIPGAPTDAASPPRYMAAHQAVAPASDVGTATLVLSAYTVSAAPFGGNTVDMHGTLDATLLLVDATHPQGDTSQPTATFHMAF